MGNTAETVIQLIALIFAVIPHEVAHGFVAFRFGDPTAKNAGRLTLNPIKHIDPIGSVLLPALLIFSGSSFLIGWAKPVPVRMDYFRHPFKDMMWVSIAGPLTNISLAFVSGLLLKVFHVNLAAPLSLSTPTGGAIYFLAAFIQINVVLAVFNLLPIPPLDGSKILANFLPPHLQILFLRLEPFGFLIVFALAYFGLFSWLLPILIDPLLKIFF
jgi:Zn-dependent protease